MNSKKEIESLVLLGCFLKEEFMLKAMYQMEDKNFIDSFNREYFRIVSENVKAGKTLDKVLVASKLQGGILDNFNKLFELDSFNGDVFDDYIKEVIDHSKKVRLKESLTNATKLVENGKSSSDAIIDKISNEIIGINKASFEKGFQHVSEGLDTFFTPSKEELSDLSFGITPLDKLIGNFRVNDFIVIAGRPSMGKTELALQLAVNAAKKGTVGLFSIEQSTPQIRNRILSHVAKVPLKSISKRDLSREHIDEVKKGITYLKNLPLLIDTDPYLSVAKLISKARLLKLMHPDLKMLLVDYIQLMDYDKHNAMEELEIISRTFKLLAKDLSVPTVALAQLSRKSESRDNKKPLASDIRSCGAIEQDADIIVSPYSDFPYTKNTEDKYRALGIVIKNREGETGEVELTNDKIRQTFYGRDEVSPESIGMYAPKVKAYVEEDDDFF